MKKRLIKKILYLLFGAFLLFVIIFWIRNQFPKSKDFSQPVEIIGRDHIAYGVKFNNYNSNPPTSGPHYEDPAPVKFYDQELPDEQLVHNLEHGDVWISYKPDIPPAIIEILKDFAGGKVIVTKRFKNDTDIALAAWGRLDKFNLENNNFNKDNLNQIKQRIKDFILRYENKGPEKENLMIR